MKIGILLLVFATVAAGQEVAPPDTSASEGPKPVAVEPAVIRPSIEHDGQSFELGNTSVSKNAETDEYVLAGEKIGDWTQLVTVQRLALGRPTGTDEFLAFFRKRVGEDGASLDVLKQGRTASVFVVRFPKSERNDEQVMVCLAFAEPGKPATLNVVQYAIKPTRAAVEVVEMRLKSWRDKFVRQAEAISGT